MWVSMLLVSPHETLFAWRRDGEAKLQGPDVQVGRPARTRRLRQLLYSNQHAEGVRRLSLASSLKARPMSSAPRTACSTLVSADRPRASSRQLMTTPPTQPEAGPAGPAGRSAGRRGACGLPGPAPP